MNDESAFPRRIKTGPMVTMAVEGGLTKKEWFAAQALQGLLANGMAADERLVAKFAVDYAEALVAELERRKK